MLGEVALDPSNPVVFLGLLLISLSALLMAAERCTSIWHKFRRTPPVEETFATKAEMTAMEQRIEGATSDNRANNEKRFAEMGSNNEKRFAEMGTKIDGITVSQQNLSNELMRAVGRLEGASREMIHAARQGVVS